MVDAKTKLLIFFVVVGIIPVVVMGGSMFLMMGYLDSRMTADAQSKVTTFLGIANAVYNEELDDVKRTAVAASLQDSVGSSLRTGTVAADLQPLLDKMVDESEIDQLTVVDKSGRVIIRATTDAKGDDMSSKPWITAALKGQTLLFTRITPEAELALDGLTEQARLDFVESPTAKPTTKTVEKDGMVLTAVTPVMDDSGNVIGAVVASNLLTKNYEIVDKAKAVYGEKGGPTVTIFQSDLRISTNVMREGKRAIGTRVSAEVYDQVLGKGQTYVGRAFVVNDWYITAYEPIKDVEGNIIGILYVGLLESEVKSEISSFLNSAIFMRLIIGAVIAIVSALVVMQVYLRSL
ncbi:MAG: cache domain-containing protein [Candidatus Altiarchaeota archaeon]|nr:cache domain-containing protein [Candidatus Altiarchaeota archaeon]